MQKIKAGEIWQVDLGLVAKSRPCLIFSDSPSDDEPALVIIIPHTTSLHGNRWEFCIPKPFLKQGAFHLQQIQPVSLSRLERKLGTLNPEELRNIREAVVQVLNLKSM